MILSRMWHLCSQISKRLNLWVQEDLGICGLLQFDQSGNPCWFIDFDREDLIDEHIVFQMYSKVHWGDQVSSISVSTTNCESTKVGQCKVRYYLWQCGEYSHAWEGLSVGKPWHFHVSTDNVDHYLWWDTNHTQHLYLRALKVSHTNPWLIGLKRSVHNNLSLGKSAPFCMSIGCTENTWPSISFEILRIGLYVGIWCSRVIACFWFDYGWCSDCIIHFVPSSTSNWWYCFALCYRRCQPWTIVLTGVTGISLSWLVIKSTLVTGIVTALVAAWWYLFLYTYPLVSFPTISIFLHGKDLPVFFFSVS